MAYHDAPEVIGDNTPPEVLNPTQQEGPNMEETPLQDQVRMGLPYTSSSDILVSDEKRTLRRRICGIPATLFYIITALLLLLIGGGIGGGITSAVAKKGSDS
jgi:hypothetical protein